LRSKTPPLPTLDKNRKKLCSTEFFFETQNSQRIKKKIETSFYKKLKRKIANRMNTQKPTDIIIMNASTEPKPIIKREADVPDDYVIPPILHHKFVVCDVVRNKNIEESSISNPNGDCYEASLKLKFKLSGIGAIRVRGGISSKFVVGQIEEGGLPSHIEHCWVEAKGLVYDWSQGRNLIMKKEDWYRMYEIGETEIGIGTAGRFKGEDFGIPKDKLHLLDLMDSKVAIAILLPQMEKI